MKKIPFILLSALSYCACSVPTATRKQEPQPSPTQTSLPSLNPNSKTQFGVMVFGQSGIQQKIKVAKELDVNVVRSSLSIDAWQGYNKMYEAFDNAGFKVVLNIGWGHVNKADGSREPVPFPKDTVEYKRKLAAILTKYKPELVVIENEEIAPVYHTGPISDYANELRAAVTVCHSFGVKVTNGGLRTIETALLAYDDYIQRSLKDSARIFMNKAFNPLMIKAMQNPGSNGKLDQFRKDAHYLIEQFADINLDYINVHWYEPLNNPDADLDVAVPDCISIVSNYLKRVTHKPLMSNEIGTTNFKPSLVSSMLQEFAKNNYAYVLWYSGNGPGKAKSLHNDNTGMLTENGNEFKRFITSK